MIGSRVAVMYISDQRESSQDLVYIMKTCLSLDIYFFALLNSHKSV